MTTKPGDRADDALTHDVFISYSRNDRRFAVALERALRRYQPPKELPVPNRRLDVFRDEEDFTGTEYYGAVQKHLEGSRKLVVVCSPEARQSAFVDDEIRRFVRVHSPADIIPVLVAGLPNNEVQSGNASSSAFPAALCEQLDLPLAADYRGFDAKSGRPDGRQHRSAWYKLIADIYGCSRAEVEEREKKRTRRRRVIWTGAAAAVTVAIGAAVVVAALQGIRADQEARTAMSNQLAGQAAAAADKDPELGTLLALEAVSYGETAAATSALRVALARLPDAIATIMPAEGFDAPTGIDFLPRQPRVAIADGQAKVRVLDIHTSQVVFEVGGDNLITWVRFSPDGKWLAAGTDGKTIVYATSGGKPVAQLQGILHWSDGQIQGETPAVLLREGDAQVITINDAGAIQLLRTVSPPGYSRDPYPPYTTAISPDGRRLATLEGEDPSRVTITELESGATSSKMLTAPSGLGGLAWSPQGRYLGASSLFGFAVLDARTLETHSALDAGNEIVVEDMNFGPNDALLATTDRGGETSLRDLTKKGEVVRLSGQETRAYRPMFSPDGALLGVVYANGRAELWDLQTHRKVATFDSLWGEVWNLAFAPSGNVLVVEYEAGRLAFWNLERWHPQRRVPLNYESVDRVRVDGTRSLLAVQAADGARAWNVASGAETAADATPFNPVEKMTAERSGTRSLRFAGRDVQVVDVPSGRQILRLPHSDEVVGATFSPDGTCVMTSSAYRMASGGAPEDGNTTRLWDAATGVFLQEWRSGTFGADAAFFLGGEHIALLYDGDAFVYRTPLCAPLATLVQLARSRVSRSLTAEERATYIGSVEAQTEPKP